MKKANKFPYTNRELSWLEFNERVYAQARIKRTPLLERIKFLAISSANLDEFFEIRVAGLLQQHTTGIVTPSLDGSPLEEQLTVLSKKTHQLAEDQNSLWLNTLVPELNRIGIHIKTIDGLQKSDIVWLRAYFQEKIYPVLTPFAIDATHPFPQISNKNINLVVQLLDHDTQEAALAILPIPRVLPTFVALPASPGHTRYVFLSDVAKLFCNELFQGYTVTKVFNFRVTRNSELYIDEEESENLLHALELELRNRHKGDAVRLEVDSDMEPELLQHLQTVLEVSSKFTFRSNAPLALSRLFQFYEIVGKPQLKYDPFVPKLPVEPINFATIRARDALLHHPYQSFQPVIDFIEQAALDPYVLGIKQTLYRTSGDSPIVKSLIVAAQQGKQVTTLVELRARFDEANNIQWAKQLEEAGVHVVYGLIRQKIHAKCSLVIRQEGDKIRHYAHVGTGNYNPKTARTYTDLSLFTAKPEITQDIAHLFNALTGFGKSPTFQNAFVAPYHLHDRMNALILAETENAKRGLPARIIAKMNSLVDRTTIGNLYTASQAGVKIELSVRGICCLTPGLAGISSNIQVRSIVGQFLEHARIFYFENNGDPLVFIGSADWMPRNFFNRVEVVIPILDPQIKDQIITSILHVELEHERGAWQLCSNGEYKPLPQKSASRISAQEAYVQLYNA